MGILISGADMPKSCGLCPCVDEEIHMSVYDQEEIHPNCTVQVWMNSFTGDVSIGWWDNEEAE